MIYKDCLDIVASWAAILTAAVAVFAYGRYLHEKKTRRVRLEEYLEDEREGRNDIEGGQGKRTLVHLVAALGMTEAEIVDAAFRSKKIRRVVSVGFDGKADKLMLQYDP